MNNLIKRFLMILLSICMIIPCNISIMADETNTNSDCVYYPDGQLYGKDKINIYNILSEYNYVKLVEGQTYYLNGNIYLQDNWTIDATGATIISRTECVRNLPQNGDNNYNAITNVKIIGGTWKVSKENPDKRCSVFQFSHGNNITIKDATIIADMQDHGIELIACKDVLIDNCKLPGDGNAPDKSVEEQIQIDIATEKTAPTLWNLEDGYKYCNNNCCINITIKNCEITGCRAVCANYDKSDSNSWNSFHKNITVTGCKLTGLSAEGLALFNVCGANIKNNTIISQSSLVQESYSCGVNMQLFGDSKELAKSKYVFQGNTIKGGRYGLLTYSHSDSRYGQIIAKKNKCYSSEGKEKALNLDSAIKVTNKKNKSYFWKK